MENSPTNAMENVSCASAMAEDRADTSWRRQCAVEDLAPSKWLSKDAVVVRVLLYIEPL